MRRRSGAAAFWATTRHLPYVLIPPSINVRGTVLTNCEQKGGAHVSRLCCTTKEHGAWAMEKSKTKRNSRAQKGFRQVSCAST